MFGAISKNTLLVGPGFGSLISESFVRKKYIAVVLSCKEQSNPRIMRNYAQHRYSSTSSMYDQTCNPAEITTIKSVFNVYSSDTWEQLDNSSEYFEVHYIKTKTLTSWSTHFEQTIVNTAKCVLRSMPRYA